MKILCFGDSNIYGYDPRGPFGDRYPAGSRWVDLMAQATGWDVLNAGMNGREIPHRPWETDQVLGLLERCAPVDVLVVMLGSNDLLQGCSAEEAAGRMESFLRGLPCPVVLVAPPQMQPGAWVSGEQVPEASRQLGREYRALADRLKLPFADAADWGIDLTFDGVHFSPAGHRTFAARLQTILETRFPGA